MINPLGDTEDPHFHSEIKHAYVHGLDKKLGLEVFDYEAVVDIDFDIEPEYRSWGIKGLFCDIRKVIITITWYSEDKKEESFEIDATNWAIHNDVQVTKDGQLSINDCDIDLTNNSLTIS